MTSETKEREQTVLRVIDALDHPHGGRILKTRLAGGAFPSVRELKGALLKASSPEGMEREVRVLDFPLFGGMPSDERIQRSGRADLLVREEGSGPPVAATWELRRG